MTDADLAVRITALKQAVSKAKAAIEQRRQEADALSKEMARAVGSQRQATGGA